MSNATKGDDVWSRCPEKTVTLILASFIFCCGLFGNTLVIVYVRRKQREKRKPNMVLLFHMALNNFLALCTSLPIHVVLMEIVHRSSLPVMLSNTLCVLRTLTSYVFVKMLLLTLAGICYDRYEIFVKLRKNKILSASFTRKFVVGCWITAILSSVFVSYGYIQNALQPRSFCDHYSGLEKEHITIHGKISNALVLVDMATWIFICNLINIYALLKVWTVLRKHFEAVKSTLGQSNILRELRLVKMASYVFAAYVVLWLPYGLSRVLFLTIGHNNSTLVCFCEVYKTITYAIFSAIPFIYIGTNKNVLRETLRIIRAPTRQFRPQSIMLVAWSTIGRSISKPNENPVVSAAANAIEMFVEI